MEWNAHTYIQDNPEDLEPEVLKELNELIMIRNEIFFPDYDRYNYIPKEPIIRFSNNLRMFEMGLLSVQTNRSLNINYGWGYQLNPLYGIFTYRIFLLNQEKGSGNVMEIAILAKKRQKMEVPRSFTTKDYEGSFIDKARACLLGIKHNYDTYAPDVISGEYWDGTAYLDPRDEY